MMRQSYRWRISETQYPSVRRIMGPERYRLDDAQLEDRLSELFPGASPEDVENFMHEIQRFGSQVAPLALRALPGAIQGASQGAMIGGPWGALAGALGGGAASLLGPSGAPGPSGPVPAAVPPAGPPLPSAPAGPFPAAPGASSSAPAAQLLALLSRPETLQALLAMLMSTAGRGSIQVGSRSVPPAAFANAVSETAAQATESAAPSRSARISEYLVDAYGGARCDVANPRSRAALLLGDIARVAASESHEDVAEAWEMEAREREAWPAEVDGDADGGAIDSYEATLERWEDD